MAGEGGGSEGATEIKKQLQRLVEAIVEEEEDESDDYYSLEVIDYAIRNLLALRSLKSNRPQESAELKKGLYGLSEDCEGGGVPVEFRCPISGLPFKEPVVLASGQTYDQPFIQKWLEDGHQTCPQTNQILSHNVLTPNLTIKNMVVKWCKFRNCEVPFSIIDNDQENAAHKKSDNLIKLLEKLSSSSLSDAKSAGKELRMLTNRYPSFKALFEDVSYAIPRLFDPNLLKGVYSDEDLQEDFVATILNISIHDTGVMNMISEVPSAVSLVIKSLKGKRVEIRSHAAAMLSELSAIDSKKHELGNLGVIKLLIDLLEERHPLVAMDAASALRSLCTVVENQEKAISDGAITVLMHEVLGSIVMDEMLEILAKLSSHHKAIEEMEQHSGMVLFLNILEENTSEHNKENCVAILYTMCYYDKRKLREIRGLDNACEILSHVSQTGTSRAKRKASGILERMKSFAFVSHTT